MNDPKHADREHAPRSPSSLESRETCAGWEPKHEESTWADDGERCHEAFEAKLRGNDTLHNNLTKDLHAFVQECYDYVAPRIAGSENIILEQRHYPGHPLLREQSYGSPDIVTITGSRAQIFDEKYGRRPVTKAETNLQGWAYALAIFDTYPEVESCEIHFVVPRVHRCTSTWTAHRAQDYDRMLARVLRTVERSMLPEAKKKLCVSWDSCAYCGKKAGCVAFERTFGEVADFRELIRSKRMSKPEQLALQLNMAKLAKDWAEQVEKKLLDAAMNGEEIAGFEVRIAGGKTSTKPLNVINKVLGDDFPLDKIEEIATVPLGRLKDLYHQEIQKDTKAESEKELMELLIQGDALKTGEDTPYLYRTNKNT